MAGFNRKVAAGVAKSQGIPFSAIDDENESGDGTKVPYDSLAYEGAPEPDITPQPIQPDNESSYGSMRDFDSQQAKLDSSRADSQDRNLATNLGRVFSNVATAKPVDQSGLYDAIDKQTAMSESNATGDANRRAQVMKSIEQRKAREDAAKIYADSRRDVADVRSDQIKSSNAQRQYDREDKRTAKAEADQDKAYTQLRRDMESFRGNKQAAQAAMDSYSAEKALALVKDRDPNTLTTQELNLLANEMGKIASGGIPGEHGVQAMMPSNLRTKYAEMVNFLSSKPTDAEAGEYVKKNMQYLHHMTEAANKSVASYRKNLLKGYKNRVRQEDYNEATSDYGLGDQQETPPETFSKDVVDYAAKHGITPADAQKVKDARGGK